MARYERLQARIVPLPDASYPDALRVLDDAPAVLALRGDPAVLAREAIAIVGARAATRQARSFARILAHDLARAGFVIVSGLARGIDAEAHRGALEGGGLTIGVLACGVDRIYPPEHRGLAEQIMRAGAVVSELPLGTLPRPLHFPLRNRIISGLSRAVVVVEARRRSGSLITVRHALNQGREVFVVPGAVEGPFAAGTNQLLREGARAIRSARDLLEDLGFEPSFVGSRARRERSGRARDARASSPRDGATETTEATASSGSRAVEARLEALLADGPRTADELLLEVGIDPGRVATALLELELAGRIAGERDGRLHLCGRPAAHRGGARPSLPCAPSTDARRGPMRTSGDAPEARSASGQLRDAGPAPERAPGERSKQENGS
ncbi:MAG: DNA-processing protein DprA [Myxococcota bacterium]